MFIFKLIYHLLLFYGFLIEYPIAFGLTTRRIALLLAIVTLFCHYKKVKVYIAQYINHKYFRRFFYLFIICAFISLIHTLSFTPRNDGYTSMFEVWYYFYIFLYVFVFALYCLIEFETIKDFAIVWISLILLESIAILLAVANPSINLLFYELFYVGDGRFDNTIGYGRIVGIGIHSSLGSIIMSTGCILLVLIRQKKLINDILYLILFIVFITATAFIGRTGMFVEIIALLYGGFWMGKFKGTLYLWGVAFFIITGITYLLSLMDATVAEKMLAWMEVVTDAERAQEISEYAKGSGFPPFNINMIFGLGVQRGYAPDGGMYVTDSGYVMTYTANGIVGFFCYYFALLNLMISPKLKSQNLKEKWFFILIVLIAFVIEYKEPYFQKYLYAWFVLAVSLLISKENASLMKSNLRGN